MDEIASLQQCKDPLVRAQRAASMMHHHRVAMSRLAAVRAQALVELRQSGRSAAGLAEDLGVSRQQVHRLLRSEGAAR
ncbi:MAG TPA: helix-turn-helix domain-containing protein [Acidimicrobiales bacterium]|jgi:predicted transcriptional regulator|nr:helix-turn-helix domain-containing protein [Acidimicrobiales bacterium]